MNRRFSLAVTKRRFAIRVLERRNRISPKFVYDAHRDDAFNFETEFVLAKMKTMTREEAAAFSAQAVAEAEVAIIEAADAMWEAEAAAAEAQAATAAFKKLKARRASKMMARVEEERPSD